MGPSSSSSSPVSDANRFLQITIDHILQKAPIMSDHSIPPNPVAAVMLREFRVVHRRMSSSSWGIFQGIESNRMDANK